MQTRINKDMAYGIPGTHGNGQPYFADPYIAGATVTMGGVAALDANKSSTYRNYVKLQEGPSSSGCPHGP